MRIDGIAIADVPIMASASADDLALIVQTNRLRLQSYQNLTSTYQAISGSFQVPGVSLPSVPVATSSPTDELVLIVENNGLAVKQIGFAAPSMAVGSSIVVEGIGLPSVRFSGIIDGDEYVLAMRSNQLCLIPIPASFSAGELPTFGRTFITSDSSLILEEGAGDATWSRPSAAWRFNELGLLRDVPSGCATFVGVRLVRNLVPTPSNTLAISGTKTVTMTRAATLQFSMGAGAGTATFSGTGGATGTLAAGSSRVRINKTVTAGTFIVTASVAELIDLQIADVTGYDTSYVPEYVSVGVVSSPFFGAGIDGAKYFETDWQGAPLSAASLLGVRIESAATNALAHSRNLTYGTYFSSAITGTPELLTNLDFSSGATGWTVSGEDGTHIATFSGGTLRYQSDTTTPALTIQQANVLTAGETYAVTFTLSSYTSGLLKADCFRGSPTVTSTELTKTIVAVATTTTFGFTRGTANVDVTIDSISVKLAAVTLALTATGIDGIPNTATTVTARQNDATSLQQFTVASDDRCGSAYVRRKTGTGNIWFTQNGGTNWTDITSLINSSTYVRIQITSTVTNPSVGFKISTSGDAIDVDCLQNEAGTFATSPIITTTAAVTRSSSSLAFQTESNWSDTAGTAFIEAEPYVWSTGGLLGSATNGLLESASNSGATASDGTNTANGPTGTPTGRNKLAIRWGGGAMTVASGGVLGTPGTYDGAMGLSSIGIGISSPGYFGSVAIYDYAMTDAELQAITT